MRMYDIIAAKRDAAVLTEEQIRFFVEGVTSGSLPDYQVSALLMAIYLRGMQPSETLALTVAMRDSGDCLDLSRFGGLAVDKHSTGGVGDKTTLIVAPIVACLGGVVAKMSGRGLGHTGGTVDKLEAISGYRVELSPEEFMRQAQEIGVAVVGQSGQLAPADKKLYALRDVTATVASIPLIASSIMSKKLAAGADSIVLDVKCGSGAFMKTQEEACELAQTMVDIGVGYGRRVSAIITNMDKPLGRAIGNALEVREAVEILSGAAGDLRDICVALSAHMLCLCRGWTLDEAESRVKAALASGEALRRFGMWIEAQGGDASFISAPDTLCPARFSREVRFARDGYITAMDAQGLGRTAMELGAGRAVKQDSIDPSAGVVLAAETGDLVKAGDLAATLHTGREDTLDAAEDMLRRAIAQGDAAPQPQPLIYREITR